MVNIEMALVYLSLALTSESEKEVKKSVENAIVELELAIEFTTSEIACISLADIITALLQGDDIDLIINELELIQSELI